MNSVFFCLIGANNAEKGCFFVGFDVIYLL